MTASQEGILYMIPSMVWNASLLQKMSVLFLVAGGKRGYLFILVSDS